MTTTEKQMWLESVINNLGKALLTTDETGKITYMNDLAEKISQLSEEEAIGRPLSEAIRFYGAASRQEVTLPVSKAIQSRSIYQSEQSLYTLDKDKKAIFASFSVSPIPAMKGNPGGTVVVICTYENKCCINPKILDSKPMESDPEQKVLRHTAFYTKREGQFVRVMVDEVLWIEAMENYVQLVTADNRYLVHTTMKKIADRLDQQGFVRVHRSYIVPLDRVDAIEENRLYVDGKEIPIGKSYKQDLLQALTFI